jgi:hypothetical protein
MASMGGALGLSRFMADGDYTMSRDGTGTGHDVWSSRDAASRFAFAAPLRYTSTRHWRWQVEAGFLWTGYKDNAKAPFKTAAFPDDSLKSNWLTLMMPIHAQLQFLQHSKSGWQFFEGAGPGVYRVWVEQNRKVVKDPVTKRLHTGFYPGFTGSVGVERYLKSLSAVSLEFNLTSHLVFAQRDEQFPSGFNSNVWTTELRFGANYYFDPKFEKHAGGAKTPPKK